MRDYDVVKWGQEMARVAGQWAFDVVARHVREATAAPARVADPSPLVPAAETRDSSRLDRT